jgi:hypothetical protein
MLPWILDRDVLTVEPTMAIDRGDVICYSPTPGRFIIHRVVGRHATGVWTRGDALRQAERIVFTDVLGKVVEIDRNGTVRRLDGWWARRLNVAIAWLSPLVRAILPGARWTHRRLRGPGRA